MGVTVIGNLTDTQRQQVSKLMKKTVEVNTPSLDEFKRTTRKRKIDDAGYRIAKITTMPGGHGFYTGASQGYNEPYATQSASLWVYPIRYALAMQYDVALLESLKEGTSEAKIKFFEAMQLHMEAAAKRMNQMFYGDGSGALAFSASAIGATGQATLNCATTPALTAGQTKGAVRLEFGHKYQAINPATGAVRGTFSVLTTGKASCVINVLSGTIAVGDPIVDLGSYMNATRGLAHLVSPTPRVMQGVDTALRPEFNCPEVDLNGSTISPVDIDNVKTKVRVKRNDNEKVTLKAFISPGQEALLRQQGFGYRMAVVGENGGGNVSVGVADKYIENGVKWTLDADCDEDRVYFTESEDFEQFPEKELDIADFDGNEWRMWLGANGYGSDIHMRALTYRGNNGLVGDGRSGALLRRANISGVNTQVNS